MAPSSRIRTRRNLSDWSARWCHTSRARRCVYSVSCLQWPTSSFERNHDWLVAAGCLPARLAAVPVARPAMLVLVARVVAQDRAGASCARRAARAALVEPHDGIRTLRRGDRVRCPRLGVWLALWRGLDLPILRARCVRRSGLWLRRHLVHELDAPRSASGVVAMNSAMNPARSSAVRSANLVLIARGIAASPNTSNAPITCHHKRQHPARQWQ